MASYIGNVIKRLARKVKLSFTTGAGSPNSETAATSSGIGIHDVVAAYSTLGREQHGQLAFILSCKDLTLLPRSDSQQTLVDTKPKLSTATRADRAFALARLENRVAPSIDADNLTTFAAFRAGHNLVPSEDDPTAEEITAWRQRALDRLEGQVEAYVADVVERLSYSSDITLSEPRAFEQPSGSERGFPSCAVPTLKRKQRMSTLHARAHSISSDVDELNCAAETIPSATQAAVVSTLNSEDAAPRTLKRKPAFNFPHC